MAKTGLVWALLLILLACALFYGDWVRLDSPVLQSAAILSAVFFTAGFYARVSLWAKGTPDDVQGAASGMVYMLVKRFFSPDCFFAARLYRQSRPRGVILLLTIWSFLALFAGTILVSLEYTLRVDLTSSRAFSLAMDLAGLVLLFAVLFYLGRRLWDKEARSIAVMEDYLILAAFAFIALSGFMLEGARIAYVTGPDAAWSPVGLLFSKALKACIRPEGIPRLKSTLYTAHALVVFAFIAYIPFSKQFHMFSAQVVTYRASARAEERKRLMHG